MRKLSVLLVSFCVPVLWHGPGRAVGPAGAPAPRAERPAEANAEQAFKGGQGRVLETIQTSGYTYINVEIEGSSVWAAAPRCEVKNGDTVALPPGDLIHHFHSHTLDRTFEKMYMVPCIEVQLPKP